MRAKNYFYISFQVPLLTNAHKTMETLTLDFDLSYLEELEKQYPGMQKTMLTQFTTKLPSVKKNLATQYENSQLKELADEMHILKQTIAYLGYQDFQQYLESIYTKLDDGNSEVFNESNLEFINKVCDEALIKVHQELDKMS